MIQHRIWEANLALSYLIVNEICHIYVTIDNENIKQKDLLHSLYIFLIKYNFIFLILNCDV